MSRQRRQRREGVILFIVAIVVALAALAGYTFLVAVQGDNKAATVGADQLQTELLAASGEAFVASWMAMSREERALLAEELGEEVFAQKVSRAATATSGRTADYAGTFYIVQPTIPMPPNASSINAGFQSSQPVSTGGSQASSGSTSFGTTQGRAGSITSSAGLQNDSGFAFGVVNESSKHHLATLLMWDIQWPGSARLALLQLPGMTDSTADAILDWVDADNVPREFGAEASEYETQTPAYLPRNAIPTSLEELLYVRGVTRRLLFGDGDESPGDSFSSNVTSTAATSAGSPVGGPNGASGGGSSDRSQGAGSTGRGTGPSQSGSSSRSSSTGGYAPSVSGLNYAAGGVAKPWCHFITVHSADNDQTYSGDARVFFGSNPGELQSALGEDFPEDVLKFLTAYRQFGPVEMEEGSNGEPIEPEGEYVSINSFDSEATGGGGNEGNGESRGQGGAPLANPYDLVGAIVALPPEDSGDNDDDEEGEGEGEGEGEEEPPRYLRSPLTMDKLDDEELLLALDRFSISAKRRAITGRLNLYLAPPEVVAGLPNLEPGAAEQILAARETADPLEAQYGFGWLAKSNALNSKTFKEIAPYLTTGGDVVSFEVIGSHAERRLYYRFAVTLDASNPKKIHRVNFRDLRRQGSPSLFKNLPAGLDAMAAGGFSSSLSRN